MKEKRINCGYEIVTAIRVAKNMELVIGHNANYPDMWACLYCYNETNYSTGYYCYYCGSFRQALQELADRINRNMCYTDFADL